MRRSCENFPFFKNYFFKKLFKFFFSHFSRNLRPCQTSRGGPGPPGPPSYATVQNRQNQEREDIQIFQQKYIISIPKKSLAKNMSSIMWSFLHYLLSSCEIIFPFLQIISIRQNYWQDMCLQWSPRPDPQSHQLWSLFSSNVCLVLRYFEMWGRTQVRTKIYAKIMITTGRVCGSAERIKRCSVNIQSSYLSASFSVINPFYEKQYSYSDEYEYESEWI